MINRQTSFNRFGLGRTGRQGRQYWLMYYASALGRVCYRSFFDFSILTKRLFFGGKSTIDRLSFFSILHSITGLGFYGNCYKAKWVQVLHFFNATVSALSAIYLNIITPTTTYDLHIIQEYQSSPSKHLTKLVFTRRPCPASALTPAKKSTNQITRSKQGHACVHAMCMNSSFRCRRSSHTKRTRKSLKTSSRLTWTNSATNMPSDVSFTIHEKDEINTPSATYILSSGSSGNDGGRGQRIDIAVGHRMLFDWSHIDAFICHVRFLLTVLLHTHLALIGCCFVLISYLPCLLHLPSVFHTCTCQYPGT